MKNKGKVLISKKVDEKQKLKITLPFIRETGMTVKSDKQKRF